MLKRGPWQEDSWPMLVALGSNWPSKLGIGLASGAPLQLTAELLLLPFLPFLLEPERLFSPRSQRTCVWLSLPYLLGLSPGRLASRLSAIKC